ncbi:flagellar biosynthesis protein [Pseudooceanicola batsensis HTCC2597]|uniref:Flagellar biosynthesis protein n=1 Tax=Pseudooceanicola batsensis (strain ATCC BAA-863 / DSM 15984 / KCTC 12145 / HTCC2597) TaxID=252305 RepID=A3U132_PSEBH|nr:flagellar biosynthetic protein FliR [Pseudooceanicola batsensis]EAQ02015.1 flagellar biosynthesis protein [Pseudooceanicola batsensis HTCC2597]
MDLGALLTAQFLATALVFGRIGAAMMFLPGFGESFVFVRHRLAAAVLLSLVITPLVAQGPVPSSPTDLVRAMAVEVTLGIWIGLAARVLLTAMQVAGAQIGMVSGLSNAFAPDIGSFQGSTLIATALLLGAVAVIFAADIHHLIIEALIESYFTFPPGLLMPGDLAEQMAMAAQTALHIGLSVAAPFYVMGVVLNVGLGLTNRMLPSLPVFFVAAPVLIAAGLFVLVLAVPTAIRTFMTRFVEWLGLLSF